MSRKDIVKYAKSPEMLERFREITGSNHAANSYIYSVIIAVANNESLQSCTPQSIMKSAADAATLGLSVDPNLKEAYLVPYKNKCTFQVGYRGLRNLAYNTNKVRVINDGVLYEGQEWIEDQLTGEARIGGEKSGNEIIGYFAYLQTRNWRTHTVYMTVEEIHAHKEKYAKGWNRSGSAWQTDFDKMAKKTVLRQLLDKWAELRPIVGFADGLEDTSVGEEFPELEQVTIIEPEPMTNKQIMDELGYEDDDDVSDADYEEVDDHDSAPEQEQKTEKAKDVLKERPTNYPGSKVELFGIIARGEVPYVGVSDAKQAMSDSNGEIDIAWELIMSWSKERTEEKKANKHKKKQDQPELI